MVLTLRTGADAWLEVQTSEGRFFVPFDCSAFALVEQVIKGGHWVEEHTASTKSSYGRAMGSLKSDSRSDRST